MRSIAASATIRRNYENTAKKGRLTQADVETRMGLLRPGLNLDALSDCDLIIEAVFENMEIKKDVFRKLDKIAKPGAILASNTSYLNIDEIARVTSRPDNVLGMHFFSPANVMRLLEVVRGAKTAKPVIATAMQLARKIGKIGVWSASATALSAIACWRSASARRRKLILEGAMPWDVDRVHLRLRPAHGTVRHERSRRPRHRLVEGDQQVVDHPRNPLRDGSARPEDRRRLLRL